MTRDAHRRHYLGGRLVARTTPWVSARITGDDVRAIAATIGVTVQISASGPRGPFWAMAGDRKAGGPTIVAAVERLAAVAG